MPGTGKGLVPSSRPPNDAGAARDVDAGPRPRGDAERDALIRVAAAAAGASRLDDVLELAAEEARLALGASALSVSRWDRERGVMRTLINAGQLGSGVERFPADEEYPLAQAPLPRRMLETGQPYFNSVDDPEADRVAVALLREHGKDSDMAVPIVVEGVSWGEVWAATTPGQPRFQAADLRFLGAIAGQLAVAIGRAELFSRVSRLAYEDPLTGLGNRRVLEERLHGALERARGRDTPVSVLLCDLDNLKQLNDDSGHEAGDRALIRVAEALVEACADRPGSVVTRLAGDEFCVLLDGGDLAAARALAAATFEALAAHRDGALSLSCGAAAADGAAPTPALMLRSADAALYAAKRRGGGQVCTVSESASPAPTAERRLYRGSPGQRIRSAVALAVERLDGALAGAAPLDRLEAVAAVFAEALDAAGWTVSFAPAAEGLIRSVSAAGDRDSRLRGARVGLDAEIYALRDFPATDELLRAGAGGLLVRRDDPGADAAERALLDELGYAAVLAAAASDRDGGYVIELFADERTNGLEDALPELRLTATAAIPPANERSAESARRLDELVVALARRLADVADERAACEAVVEGLDRGLGVRLCAVARVQAGAIQPVARRGPASMPAGLSQPAEVGLIGRSLRERATVLVGDVRGEPQFRVTRWTRETRSELVVPVLAGERVWGAINLEHDEPGAFDARDAGLVEAAAALLGARLQALAACGSK